MSLSVIVLTVRTFYEANDKEIEEKKTDKKKSKQDKDPLLKLPLQ